MIEIKHQGSGQVIRVDPFWLRDHCRCLQCYNVETKQRRFDLLEIPATVQPLKCSYAKEDLVLKVKWNDGHDSTYDIDFIYESQLQQTVSKRIQTSKTLHTPWNQAIIQQSGRKLHVSLPEFVTSDDLVKQVVHNLVQYGIAFIEAVPPNTTMTEMAIRRIFPVMKTFFGEMFTFSDVQDHSDTAYSKEYLGSHTDNTYFCDAAGLQVLHCIEHINGTGGENFFLDGMFAALELKRRNPKAFQILSRVSVPAEYIEMGQQHRHSAPIIRVDPLTDEIVQLRLNIYDRAVFNTIPQGEMAEFYASLREFLNIVKCTDNQWKFKLHPGTVVIFDNWRVFHGRYAYTGQRTMTGCYVQRTDYLSKARTMGIID